MGWTSVLPRYTRGTKKYCSSLVWYSQASKKGMNIGTSSLHQSTHARTRPYSLQHRKDEWKRKRYWLVLMIVMLCVYIGALQKSGIVVCQKQFQAFVVGKLGRNYKKFQSMSGPNRCAVSLQLSFDLYSSTAGKDRFESGIRNEFEPNSTYIENPFEPRSSLIRIAVGSGSDIC